MKTFGLIGKNIDYSFSRKYFQEKFINEKISDCEYVNFDIENISEVTKILNNKNSGFNVTIPYKETIIQYLDKLSSEAEKIGAVNTIKVHKNGILEGFNTDYYGFTESLKPYLKDNMNSALILGTGGASKAIKFALNQLNIKHISVSRTPKINEISYDSLSENLFTEINIVINTTPIGTYPNVENFPNIPYSFLNEKHIVYDLVYNPLETAFLTKAKNQNSIIINGLEMLKLQAEKAWEIWNKNN